MATSHGVLSKKMSEKHDNVCRVCHHHLCIDSRLPANELVCVKCGLVQESVNFSPNGPVIPRKYYQRRFYFSERMSRWCCTEPEIDELSWFIIKDEAYGNPQKYPNIRKKCRRQDVRKILKSIKLPKIFMHRLRSKKYKKNPMTNERFYNKFYEKWRSISWMLTRKKPALPSFLLVKKMIFMFDQMQHIFERIRHVDECDGSYQCDKYYGCKHNFLNYDFIIRKLLQIAELKFGWHGCFKRFKNDFPVTSKRIRNTQLRPFFKKMADELGWPCPDDE